MSQWKRNIVLIFGCLIIAFVSCNKPTYWTKNDKTEIVHLWKSISSYQEIAKMHNKSASFHVENEEEIQKTIRFLKNSISEAGFVSDETLDKILPDFKATYRNNFQKGVQLFLGGILEGDNQKSLSGQVLIDEWGEWYSDHMSDIEKSIKRDS